MRNRTLAAFAPLFLALAACGGSATPASTTNPVGPGPDPVTNGDVPVAKSSLARDPESSIAPASLQGAATANNAFALDLYAHLLAQPGNASSNLLTSPISASLALTMTYAGAKGTTAAQMATALHLGASASTIFDGQNALSQELASRAAASLAMNQKLATENEQPAPSSDDYQLQVVNSVWGEKTYTWESPFLDTLAKSYGTGVYQEDFLNQFDQARQTINSWVSTETNEKINNLLPSGSLDDSTRMVLVNAIHLKLPWATAFQTSATAPATFTTAANAPVSVPFMNMTGSFPYIDDGKAQTIALPLSNNQLSVLITLPHGDLATYEAGLTTTSPAITSPSVQGLVALSLPKVTFTSPTFSLATILQSMGMTDAFNFSSADFTGLCAHPPDGKNLFIADVLQKAMIGIQETGVEAAAATAVIVGTGSAEGPPPPPPTPMVVNKPYLVSIVDVPTGAVLFLGHIEDASNAGTP
jgi:serpin B